MQTFNYNITTKSLDESINTQEYDLIYAYKEILIQLFSGQTYEYTYQILQTIKKKFSHAKIIITSTDGEIINNLVSTKNVIVSISVFEKTDLRIAYVNSVIKEKKVKNCFFNGVEIAKKLVTNKTRLLILFVDGINTNGEKFLEGVYSIAPDIMVAGGLSGDNGSFVECFVGVDSELYTQGVVGVAFDSDDLIVHNLYNFGWDKIGIAHTITKAEGNCVYEIDNIKAIEFYKKYLGRESANNLPSMGIEFPLLYEKDGIPIARAMLADNGDGSLMFGGNIAENTQVYLGIGDITKIITNHIDNLSSFNHESFFIYSCMARRRFIPNDIYRELTQFSKHAPVSGFFTYGEFYTAKKHELLNQTLTAVSLSENTHTIISKGDIFAERRNIDTNSATVRTLTNILNQTYNDLEEKNQILNESIDHFKVLFNTALEGIVISDENFKIIDINEVALKIFHYSDKKEVVYKKYIMDYVSNLQLKKVKEQLQKESTEPYELDVYTKDKKLLSILTSGKTLIRNGQKLRITTIIDLSNIKLKEQQLIEKSRLAQMGEMIGMIAHQWRQPLNTINIIATKVKIKSELDLLDHDEVLKNTNSIEKITEGMSQTIEDFMNLTNPNIEKEKIVFSKMFEEVTRILGEQFHAYNITLKLVDDSNIEIIVQKNELIHTLINILGNARDALNLSNTESKAVTVSILRDENVVKIFIKDNAGGVEEQYLHRIFEPYFTTKEQGKGTGLGLYMSKKILNEVLDGDISVSNDAEGAVFKIVLEQKEKD